MKEIAQILLFDREGRLLIYLRDNKPEIPFPDCWDFFGGHIEAGETPEQALVREVSEELGVRLDRWQFFRRYECLSGDAYPNIKHIFHAQIDRRAAELTLFEGQRIAAIRCDERFEFRFANILAAILADFVGSGLWPHPVDNSFRGIPAK
jgi:ADP-ribose pyrophosphatase